MNEMEILLGDIKKILDSKNTALNLGDTLDELSKCRNLGSSNQCYNIMYKITQSFNVKKILEIGTHRALSTIVFCQAIMDNNIVPEIHTIDNWSQENVEDIAKNNIIRSGFEQYIIMYTGDSSIEVPKIFKKIKRVDLVFIDGNHHPKAILQDFDNCKQYADIIIFHDTKDGQDYFEYIKQNGFQIYNFETRYVEGDGHLVGIALAIKTKK